MKVFRKGLLAGLLIVCFFVWGFGATTTIYAQQMTVGTIQLEQVYDSYQRVKDFRGKVEEARQEILELKNNPEVGQKEVEQRVQELQINLTQEQKQINKDIEDAGEQIADEQNLKLIVGAVLYKDEDIQVEDITQPVIQLLNETYEGKQ